MGESLAVPEGGEFASWALPLIFDRLFDHYRGCDGADLGRAGEIAGFHGLLWQAVIMGDVARGDALRHALADLAASLHVPVRAVEEADALVFVELLAVVARRFRNSRRLTKAYCLMLEEILRRLRASISPPPAQVTLDFSRLATGSGEARRRTSPGQSPLG